MYTHIGNGIILKNKEIIGVFDRKTIEFSKENKRIQFDIRKIEEKETENTKKEKNKSIILLESKNEYENHYELSNIAVTTLKKRLEKQSKLTKERE